MAGRSVLYIGTVIDSNIAELYGIKDYSLAGDNKKRNVIEALQEMENSVTIIAPMFVNEGAVTARRGGRFRDESLNIPVRVPPVVGAFGLSYFVLAFTTSLVVLSEIRRIRPDVILFYNLQVPTTIPAMVARIVTGIPAVLEYEDGMFVDPETASVVRASSVLLYKMFDDMIDGAICASGPLADRLSTENTAVFRGLPSIGMPDELPAPIDGNDPYTVMFAGRFDDVRGIEKFLEIAPAIAKRSNNVQFWVSGYGDEQMCRKIERRVKNLPCEAHYFGTLQWEEYRQRIVSADVLVNLQNPSLSISKYTFPSKLLDFMSAGGTIVSTEVGDVGVEFREEIFLTDFDRVSITKAIQTCIEDDELAMKYSVRSRNWVENNCDIIHVSETLSSVLSGAIKE